MSWATSAGPAEESAELLDEFLASYVVWRESCEAVDAAYKWWATCEPARRGLAYESYRAALAWEEFAAQVHSDRTARFRAVKGSARPADERESAAEQR
jgi:putative intracellular protease/amidase